jgi:hypothetical protein
MLLGALCIYAAGLCCIHPVHSFEPDYKTYHSSRSPYEKRSNPEITFWQLPDFQPVIPTSNALF